ncbi:MAG: hypothetical protein A4E19_19755 [Nitrospira sp. SG-bin1]|nr:MAG: hypothetical protein A4E19_19755 [Nitrospira sp. SG-bin1]
MDRLTTLLLLTLLVSGSTACDATRELVKAPFEATTALSNGTTQASKEILEPLKEFTSSTTPGAMYNDPLKAKHRFQVFIAYTFDNVQRDIAQGKGEYLTSLATLADIPQERRPEFFAMLQNRYAAIYSTDKPIESLHRLVAVAWPEHGSEK